MATQTFKKEKITKTFVYDLEKIPTGTYYKLNFNGRSITGLVINDPAKKCIYLGHNDSGFDNGGRQGQDFNYSYRLSYTNNDPKVWPHFKALNFPTKPKGYKPPIVMPKMAGYDPIIRKGGVRFGCQCVSNENIRLLAKNLID